MDFNIAAAFWFASRGMGRLYQPAPVPLTPPPAAPVPLTPPLPPAAGTVATGDIRCGNLNLYSEETCRARPCAPAIPWPSREPGIEVGVTISEEQGFAAAGAWSVTAVADGKRPTEEIWFSETVVSGLVSGGENQRGNGAPSAYGGKSHIPGSGSGTGQKRSKKVNKNMDELCPVDGCRRLLKPGCVFGSCSKCCLKAQQLVAAAAAATPSVGTNIADSSWSDRRVAPSVGATSSAACEGSETNVPKTGKTVVTGPDLADDIGDTSSSLSNARPGLQGEQERCKARAAAQHLRALEDHLMGHFIELSPPFRVDHLCAVLKRKVSTREARTGRDLHARTRTQQSTKVCVVHKRSTPNPVAGDNVGHAHVGGEIGGHEHARPGGPGAREREVAEAVGERSSLLGSISTSGAPFTSEAKVLLVGIGADEFLGGYSRHRNAYNQGGEGSRIRAAGAVCVHDSCRSLVVARRSGPRISAYKPAHCCPRGGLSVAFALVAYLVCPRIQHIVFAA